MRILVCGSGPSLPMQLKDKSLDDYFVVRVNPWEELESCDNRCDAWAFYPYAEDIKRYLKRTKTVWMPHHSLAEECERVTGIKPSYTISMQQTNNFHRALGHSHPTSGAVVIYMAMLLNAKVHIAGFDFYKGDKGHYYNYEKPTEHTMSHHRPEIEEKWVNEQIKDKKLFKFTGED